MGCLQDHRGSGSIVMGSKPVACGDTPPIPRHQTGEQEPGHWCHEIIADRSLVLEELPGDHRTNGVAAEIFGTRGTAAIPKEPGNRIEAAGLQRPTQHIARRHDISMPRIGNFTVSAGVKYARDTIVPKECTVGQTMPSQPLTHLLPALLGALGGGAIGILISVALGPLPGAPFALPGAAAVVGLLAIPWLWSSVAAPRWARTAATVLWIVMIPVASVFVMAAVGLSRMQ